MLVLSSPSGQGRYGYGTRSPHHLRRQYPGEGLRLLVGAVYNE